MIRFGPAGNAQRFYDEGYKSSAQAPAWLASMGLNAYEYSAGHGVSIGDEAAKKIGTAAAEASVAMSIHAPYYINCCADGEDRLNGNIRYFMDAARALSLFGGRRLVFHIGAPGKADRRAAGDVARRTISAVRAALDEGGYADVILCPETMGKLGQFGTLEEVLSFVRADERMLPTIDFAHLHAAGQGGIKSAEDFEKIILSMINEIGVERARTFHSHFSHIAYSAKGEKHHVTFADEGYGPDFGLLAPIIVKYDLRPTVICESKATQADDAAAMRSEYQRAAGLA